MAKVSIHEVRRLVLPVETVVDAVLQFDRDRSGELVGATLLAAAVEPGAEGGLSLSLRLAGQTAAVERRFALPMIAAAIINYCYQSRIPLPRTGAKKLEILPEGFAFTIESHLQLPRRHDSIPLSGPLSVAVPVSEAVLAPGAPDPAPPGVAS
jgi:hypothetical protein